MPSILKIRVESAKALPVLDRTTDLVDAYVEIRFADTESQRTTVCRKSVNPVWKQDFRIEVPEDAQLQDEPLELKIFDFDAISADSSLGGVFVDLNPLLCPDAPNQMSGWFPIYDTIRGGHGELFLVIKLEFIENVNPFAEASVGVHMFTSSGIPPPYTHTTILGLVDHVMTETDPDYHWSDSFRNNRSSNEASQRLLNQMSCRMKRQMGIRAIEMGGNSILGYKQFIDIESYSQTITVRALGTAAILQLPAESSSSDDGGSGSGDENKTQNAHSVRSDDRSRMHHSSLHSMHSVLLASRNIEMSTLCDISTDSILSSAGIISAKTIKLISEESDYTLAKVREEWLEELRAEIKANARSFGCNLVLAYNEQISIQDSLYVLYAEGTAVRVPKLRFSGGGGLISAAGDARALKSTPYNSQIYSNEEDEDEDRDNKNKSRDKISPPHNNYSSSSSKATALSPPNTKHQESQSQRNKKIRKRKNCTALHLPPRYKTNTLGNEISEDDERCLLCGRGRVGEVYWSGCQLRDEHVLIKPDKILIEAYICRPLKAQREGEGVAVSVSSNLPFVEYELYRQLLMKMRYHGCNALFSLQFQLIANDGMIIAVASSTGVCLAALPCPRLLQISRNIEVRDQEDLEIVQFQEEIADCALETHEHNEKLYYEQLNYRKNNGESDDGSGASTSSSSSSDSSGTDDSSSSTDNEAIVQIDDEADEDLLLTLVEPKQSMNITGTIQQETKRTRKRNGTIRKSHYICHFKRFAIDLESLNHPNATLASLFHEQYCEIHNEFLDDAHKHNQEPGQDKNIEICNVKHQICLVRGVELQILTTAMISLDCNESIDDAESSMADHLNSLSLRQKDDGNPPKSSSSSTIQFTASRSLPNTKFTSNCGCITVQLFKEINLSDAKGGFTGFILATITDVHAMARGVGGALGGNLLTCLHFANAGFYENFKNQLHAVVMMTADVVNISSVSVDHGDGLLDCCET